MATKYKFPENGDPEKEKARIVQNLSVIAHDLHFVNLGERVMSADLYSYEIANAVGFINYLYEKAYGGKNE